LRTNDADPDQGHSVLHFRHLMFAEFIKHHLALLL